MLILKTLLFWLLLAVITSGLNAKFIGLSNMLEVANQSKSAEQADELSLSTELSSSSSLANVGPVAEKLQSVCAFGEPLEQLSEVMDLLENIFDGNMSRMDNKERSVLCLKATYRSIVSRLANVSTVDSPVARLVQIQQDIRAAIKSFQNGTSDEADNRGPVTDCLAQITILGRVVAFEEWLQRRKLCRPCKVQERPWYNIKPELYELGMMVSNACHSLSNFHLYLVLFVSVVVAAVLFNVCSTESRKKTNGQSKDKQQQQKAPLGPIRG